MEVNKLAEEKNRHMRNVRAIVGHVICSFNEQSPKAARETGIFYASEELVSGYHIVDTPEDRALGLLFYTKNSQKLERRLERAGLMVLKNQQIKIHGIQNRKMTPPTLLTVRVPEEQDVEA